MSSLFNDQQANTVRDVTRALSDLIEADVPTEEADSEEETTSDAVSPEAVSCATSVIDKTIKHLQALVKDIQANTLNEAPTTVQDGETFLKKELGSKCNDNVLIITQLGVIGHQIKAQLEALQTDTTKFCIRMVNDTYGAIEAFKKKKTGLVIVDVMLPSQEDGLFAISEIRLLAKANEIETRIIALYHPMDRETHIHAMLKRQGSNIIIDKNEGWQDVLLAACKHP